MRSELWRGVVVSAWILACACSDEAAGTEDTGTMRAGAGAGASGSASPSSSGSSGSAPRAGSSSAAGGQGAAGGPSAGAGGGTSAGSGASGTGSGGAGASGMQGGTSGAGGTGAAGSGASDALRVSIKMAAVPTGQEDHVCVVRELPNESAVWVKAIRATLTAGSHHLIVDRVAASTAVRDTAATCPPTMGGEASRLVIAQQPLTNVVLPEGTAFRIEPRQRIFLQLHYINYTSQTADIEGVVELEPFATTEGTPIEVHSRFTGDMSLDIPAGQEALGEFFFTPMGTTARPLQVFAITSHTHSLGVKSTIERVPSRTAPDSTPIHESTSWAEPPLTQFDPPLQFTGQDGLRLRCHYMNDTENDVGFGTRFEDEMCFLWLYYFQRP